MRWFATTSLGLTVLVVGTACRPHGSRCAGRFGRVRAVAARSAGARSASLDAAKSISDFPAIKSQLLIRSPRRRALISLPEKAQPSGRTWHQLRLLLVPVQGGKGVHPGQRRAEPALPARDKITALAQDSHPYHVGRLLPLPRRGRINRRAAARTECLQAWIAALGRGLEVCRRLARYAKGRTGNGNIDAEGGAGADLAIRAVANRGLLGVRFAFDLDIAAVAPAVDFHEFVPFPRSASAIAFIGTPLQVSDILRRSR